ncbi:MAG: site-2 protease family protein [Chloroflexi bacterium]|jgi:Zn-dependent protease|uniref:Zinc metalloprotease n=1 Tax=Candidatus Thermofonsia Clade 3 bacterium TaxID=2364212 RepID=A0A2M8QBA5_9CHLR|nr:site-2 protease family protein [Candidatus Roseilinea sp. NK_OTU-006]PJF47081.1 MAG: peptidase M50 [Candidatus Thermofonsia Clade 3 bacterium]RMG63307.1 MAG: site-2 protease family protein [Chloroflexota bacterium]
MGWSFNIARVRGIDIKVHATFFLILIFGALQWAGSVPGNPLEGALFGMMLMILLFTCVTLHELGHSIVAQLFNIPVREIVLLPLGGVAMIAKSPEKPWHELLIAAAGPAVNVLIAALLFLATGGIGVNLDVNALLVTLREPSLITMLIWLLFANISLVVFNLIPAFPLDGGRILRAVLAMGLGNARATRIASTIGQISAVLLGILGIANGQLLLTLIALFIFFSAGQERGLTEARTVLNTLRVGDAYNKHALSLQIGDRVSTVVEYILTSYQPDFAVMQGNQIIGVITRNDVLRTLATDSIDRYVTEIMQRDFLRVEAHRSLDEVREILMESGAQLAAVFDGSRYLGLISLDDISEAFTVLTFVRRQNGLRRQGNATL